MAVLPECQLMFLAAFALCWSVVLQNFGMVWDCEVEQGGSDCELDLCEWLTGGCDSVMDLWEYLILCLGWWK